MFEEKIELKSVNPNLLFLLAVVAVLLVYLISLLNLPFKGIIVIALFVALAWTIYRYIYSGLKEFWYMIDDDDVLKIREKIGSKDLIVAELELCDIIAVYKNGVNDEAYKDYQMIGDYKAGYDRDFYYMVFSNEEMKGKIAFKASERLIDELKTRGVSVE